jgi:hypothetical protein
MHHERGNLFRIEISGVLLKAELERCEKQLLSEMKRIGSVRLLFELTEFQGWEPRTDWNDLTFYVRHGDAIQRIAIVGPARWRSEALMFAAADLRRAPVEFFTEADAAQARAWVSA